MGNYSAQSAARGRPNAAAAAPQIGINFSRREGASPEPRRLSRPKGTRPSRPPTKDFSTDTHDASKRTATRQESLCHSAPLSGGGNETGEELTNNVGRGRAPRA